MTSSIDSTVLAPSVDGTALRIDQCGPGTTSGRYLRLFWMPVALLDDVVPGRAKTIALLGEHFTYYRAPSGTPHLVGALCAHRHVALAVGWVEDDCIRCPYHGWKYDATGQCLEQPAEHDGFARKVRIAGYPTRVLHGIVFAYFGPGEPPAFQRLAPLERPGHIWTSSYVRKTNFLNAVENNADWIHINFVHGRSNFTEIGVNRSLPTVSADETAYGIAGHCTYPDGKVTDFHMLMPLASYLRVTTGLATNARDTSDHIAWRVPIDDYSHRSFIISKVELEGDELERFLEKKRDQQRLAESLATSQDEVVSAILRGELHVDDVSTARPDIVGIQDEAVMHTQPPIGEREPDQLGASDIPVIKLRRLWYREVRAFAEGRPTTVWDWSAGDLTAKLGI